MTGLSVNAFPIKTLIFWVVGACMLVAAGLGAGMFLTQRTSPEMLEQQLRTLHVTHAHERAERESHIVASNARIQHLQQLLTIEQAARAELEKSLSTLQEELGRHKDHLAFYEQLLPPGPQGALALRAVEFERQSQTLVFRVLSMRSGQSGKPADRFNGRLQFVATGTQGGKDVTIVLQPSQRAVGLGVSMSPLNTLGAASEDQDSLTLSIDQFQRSQGVLALPIDFVPAFIVVSILSGEIVLASRKVDL